MRGRDSIQKWEVFLGWRVQDREGRMISKERLALAHTVVAQSLEGDQIIAKEIEFQKPDVGLCFAPSTLLQTLLYVS